MKNVRRGKFLFSVHTSYCNSSLQMIIVVVYVIVYYKCQSSTHVAIFNSIKFNT